MPNQRQTKHLFQISEPTDKRYATKRNRKKCVCVCVRLCVFEQYTSLTTTASDYHKFVQFDTKENSMKNKKEK